MVDANVPIFQSVENECRYWKERAKFFHKEWTDMRQEFDEYVEQSRQVEAEMDATCEQNQNVIKDLRSQIITLEKENESLKRKSELNAVDFSNMEIQLDTAKKENNSMKEYMRQLEQKNDDLERAHRILNESIVDFEKMLEKEYEKNALLEMEIDEKGVLQEKLQRLMDETRDLKQELNVKTRHPTTNGSIDENFDIIINNENMNNGDNKITTTTTAAAAATTVTATATSGVSTPTAMMAALNIYNNDPNNLRSNNVALNHHHHHHHLNHHQQQIQQLQQQQQQHQLQQQTLKRRPLNDPDNLLNGNSITPSSRTSALNIVADMLRKLNAMETKLKSYREQDGNKPRP